MPPLLDELLDRLVRDVPDHPRPGVVFKDLTPLLADAHGLRAVVDALVSYASEVGPVDVVVGVEARGFVLGAPLAVALGTGFVGVRKAGKLPGDTHRVGYDLEYGSAELEVHTDAFAPGARVLLVDDVLATGGTLAAAHTLVRRCGARPVGVAVLLELAFLQGRARLSDTLTGVGLHALRTVA